MRSDSEKAGVLRTVGAAAVLLVLSSGAGCGTGDPAAESTQVTRADSLTDWQFWSYTSGGTYPFNPNGSGACADNCPTCNSCYTGRSPCLASCTYYKNCPTNWDDLDWSGGSYWNRGAVFYLPCDAKYIGGPMISSCGGMWQAQFQCVTGPSQGLYFNINHLQHPTSADNGWLTVGSVYNAGTPVGREGGSAYNEGNIGGSATCSTGDHLCMETPMSSGAACVVFPTDYVPFSTCLNQNGNSAANGGLSNVFGCMSPGPATCSSNFMNRDERFCWDRSSNIQNGTADVLYGCYNNVVTVARRCPAGCYKNPSAPASDVDYCNPPAYGGFGGSLNCIPSCSGKTCGNDGCGGSCGTCSSGYSCSSAQTCVATSPICPTGSNWHLAGQYCWNQPGMINTTASHLYNCSGAGAVASDWGNCGEGCHNEPPGVNDICYNAYCPTGGYWYGAGLYCGRASGMGNANPTIVYYCGGPGYKASINQVCGGYCAVAPPGYNDHC